MNTRNLTQSNFMKTIYKKFPNEIKEAGINSRKELGQRYAKMNAETEASLFKPDGRINEEGIKEIKELAEYDGIKLGKNPTWNSIVEKSGIKGAELDFSEATKTTSLDVIA